MPLDPRLILAQRPLESFADMQDKRTQREIQQQEVELRRQEIMARRDAIIDAQRQRNQPKPYDPVEAGHEYDLRVKQAAGVAALLEQATDPDTYEQAKQGIAQIVGPDYVQHLPPTYDKATNDRLVAQGKALIAKAATTAGKTREIRVPQADGSERIMIVSDEAGQEWTGAPKSVAAAADAKPGTFEYYLFSTYGANPTKAQQLAARQEWARSDDAPAGAGSPEPLVDIVGPDGKRILVPRSQAAGKTPGAAGAASSKPPTGVQTKTLGYFNRARQADEDLQNIEPKIAQMGYLDQERMKRAPNLFQTQTGQSYNQAQRAFTEARLRKDSGAAIPESEFANDRVTYFAQPGDTAKTLADKARARAEVLASLAFEAGSALDGFYGDDAPTMIQGYKDRAKGGGGPSFSVKAPNNKTYYFKTQAELDAFKKKAGIP